MKLTGKYSYTSIFLSCIFLSLVLWHLWRQQEQTQRRWQTSDWPLNGDFLTAQSLPRFLLAFGTPALQNTEAGRKQVEWLLVLWPV